MRIHSRAEFELFDFHCDVEPIYQRNCHGHAGRNSEDTEIEDL